jgi:hypothetical protein
MVSMDCINNLRYITCSGLLPILARYVSRKPNGEEVVKTQTKDCIKICIVLCIVFGIFITGGIKVVNTTMKDRNDEATRRTEVMKHISGDIALVELYMIANKDNYISVSEHEALTSIPNKSIK